MSNSLKSPSTGGVKISNVQLVNLPSGHSAYSVEIGNNIDTVKRQLQEKRVDGDRVVWPESLTFASDLADQSFYFKIVRTRFGMKKTVGSCKEKVMDLFQLQDDSGCQLEFRIEQQHDVLSDLVNGADITPVGTSTHPSEISNIVMKAHDIFTDQEDIWTPFLSHFEVFMKAMDKISEVHPYVKLAWGILSVIPKTIISQNNRNDSINKLVQRLKEVYEFIIDAKNLPTLKETQSKALSVLVQQTIECAYFLREYGELHTVKKILTGISIDGKVRDFNEKFDNILDVMTNSVALETSIVTLRTSDDISGLRKDVEETKDLTLLGELPYAHNAGLLSTKRCLPGTREKLITEILDWTNGNGVQRLLLLLGQAGTGKSSVAQTISQIFDKQNRLGALFCFSRSYRDRRNLLFSTISRQLADGDIQWRERLIPIIQKTSIRTSLDILTQFDELIVKPSENLNTIGPVIIVIDGLDESGDRKEREELLEILFKRCSELPPNYRFVVTSRPESDIEEWSKHPTVLCKHMADLNSSETAMDIQKYISFRLSRAEDALNEALGVDWRSLLTERAEGLFQWASTVCDFINPAVEFGLGRRVKFISGSTSSLYQLYHQIFTSQQEFNEPGYLPAFKIIMGALIIAREPLSIRALQSLFHDDICDGVKSIMQPFHSLFLGIHDLDTPIRPLHTSLTDFLTTRFIDIVDDKHDIKTTTKVDNQFYIDTSDQGYFALACLKLMNNGESGLRFNICNLETSHRPNQDVSDLDHRIQAAIPSHLSYACYFWAIHLENSEKHSNFSNNLLEQLRFLMRTNVLYLFEVLSLLREVEQVCISMNILADWCEGVDNELVKQAKDTCQFGYDSEDVIMKSTPHLYISALPFAREDSFIRSQYLDSFPHHFGIELGQSLDLPRNPDVIKRNVSSKGCAVAFSPRGRYIATSFESGELWLWNYRTGKTVHKWGKHNSRIQSMVFSRNGESVTACFWCPGDVVPVQISTWDIGRNEISTTGVPLLSFKGRSTISNDGQFLVIDESDIEQTLLFDIKTRSEPKKLACFPRLTYGPKSIFSPNEDFLAFQLGRDNVISVWSNLTRNLIGSLKLSECVRGMTFFPDGNRIGVGLDTGVEIWDVLTKTRIGRFRSDYSIEFDLVIFPDGQHLVFSSNRVTYVRSVSTGDLVQSFTSDSDVRSLAVSPDCKHIASIGTDGTIRVQEWENVSKTTDVCDSLWYAKAQLSPGGGYLILEGWKASQCYLRIFNTTTMGEITDQVQLRRSGPITAVSPDDQHIAYATTNGLCLWSARSGEVVLDTSCDFTAFAFSFNSDYLISGDRGGNVIIWNTYSYQPFKMMSSKAYITALAFSTTGTRFLVVYLSNIDKSGNAVEIHDSQSGEILKGPFTCTRSFWPIRIGHDLVAFSANESRIVYIIFREGFIFDTETGQILNTFAVDSFFDERLSQMLSPDRKYLLIKMNEDTENIWNIDEDVEIEGQWLASRDSAIVFSNKAEEVLTVHAGRIGFWDISTGTKTMTRTFYPKREELDGYVQSVSSNKKFLVLVVDGSIKIWNLAERQAMFCVYENQVEGLELSKAGGDQNLPKLVEQERREYALMAWQKALFSDSSEMDENGWILGPHQELLFWVPRERWSGLWRAGMVYAAGRGAITKLNFNNFVHGSSWTECKEPLIS